MLHLKPRALTNASHTNIAAIRHAYLTHAMISLIQILDTATEDGVLTALMTTNAPVGQHAKQTDMATTNASQTNVNTTTNARLTSATKISHATIVKM